MRKYFIFAVLFLLPTTVFAQRRGNDDWRRGSSRDAPSANAFELTPFLGYRWGGTIFADQTTVFTEDVDVADSAGFGIELGIPLGDTGMKLELMANRQSSDLESASGLFSPDSRVADIDVTYYHAGLQVPFAQSRNAVPYAVVSAGVTNLDPQISGVKAENKFSASAGLGVKIPVNRSLSFRLEGRGYYTNLQENGGGCRQCSYRYNQEFYQGEVNLGMTFSF